MFGRERLGQCDPVPVVGHVGSRNTLGQLAGSLVRLAEGNLAEKLPGVELAGREFSLQEGEELGVRRGVVGVIEMGWVHQAASHQHGPQPVDAGANKCRIGFAGQVTGEHQSRPELGRLGLLSLFELGDLDRDASRQSRPGGLLAGFEHRFEFTVGLGRLFLDIGEDAEVIGLRVGLDRWMIVTLGTHDIAAQENSRNVLGDLVRIATSASRLQELAGWLVGRVLLLHEQQS